MQAQLIQKLKRLLVQSENFHVIQSFFDNHIDRAPWLLDISEKAENLDIHDICVATCNKIDDRARLKGIELRYTAEHRFWHGDLRFERKLGFVFYFEDIRKGLLLHIDGTGASRRARFTLRTDMHWPSLN